VPKVPGLPPAVPASAPAVDGHAHTRRRLVASAGIIAVGQLLSSVLGFVRIAVLNVLFYPVASGPFVTALRPIQQVSDLLVGGSVSGALIPTFVDYAGERQRDELRRIYSTVANLVLIVMGVATLGVVLAAPAFIPFETQKYTPADQQLTVLLVRIAAFSLFGLGLYAATSALLYGLKRVVFPAFATGVYHIGIVICGVAALLVAAGSLHLPLTAMFQSGPASAAVLQARSLGARGLAAGAALGALGEFLILIPGLRQARIGWRPVLDLRHPAVRQILRLYGPIAVGLIISVLYQNLDLTLIGLTTGGAEANTTALATGTVLTQFPVGLVAAALSFAVLPPLTAAASRTDVDDFKRTLRFGFRLGLLLMVPAAVGLYILRVPIVALLFQHGACSTACTYRNALAVQNYAYELPFIVLDQLLIAAFYARKNTLVPNVVGVISIAFYAAIALPLHTSVGMPALAFADTAKNTGHAIILFVLLTLAMGNLGLGDLFGGIGRILLAAAAMALVAWGLLQLLPTWLPAVFSLAGTGGRLALFVVSGGAAAAVYFALVALLGVEELRAVLGILRARIGRA
jgi:putative peptidoglycan lipid II flippase